MCDDVLINSTCDPSRVRAPYLSLSLSLYFSLAFALSCTQCVHTRHVVHERHTELGVTPSQKNKLAAIYAEALKNENPRKILPCPLPLIFFIFSKAYTCIPTKGRAPPKIFVALMGLILSGISRRFQPFSTPPPTQPCRPVP